MKGFAHRSFQGLSIGAFIAVLTMVMIIWFGEVEVISGREYIRNSLGSMAVGWFFSISTYLFETDKISLLQKTGLHFAILAIFYFGISYILNWIPFSAESFIWILGAFILIYAVIWLLFYFYYRHQVMQINKEI